MGFSNYRALCPCCRKWQSCFVSGLLGAKPDGTLPEDPDLQLSQMFANVDELLKALGIAKDAVVKTTVFMKDMSYAAKLNERYAAFLEVIYQLGV